jgi:transcriptional regulator with XRE-family HTH domain
MSFYVTLEYVMNEKGITAAELSRRTGLYRSFFTNMKMGRAKMPSWENAIKIVHALDMTLDEFAALEDELSCK